MTMFYNRSPSQIEVATPFIQSLDWGLYPWRHSGYTAPAPTSPLLSSWDHPLAFTKYGVVDIDDKLTYMEQQIIRLHKWMDSVWREFGGEIDTEIRNFNKNHSQIQNQSKNKDHKSRWGINGTGTEAETEAETNTDKSTKLNSNTQSINSILNSHKLFDSNSELKPAKTTFIPISVSETNSLNINTNRTGTSTGTGTRTVLPVRPEIVEIAEESQSQSYQHAKNHRQTQIQVQNQRKTYRLNVHLGSSFPPESVIVKVSLKNRVMTIAAKSEEKSETGDENDSTFSRVCREIIRKFTLPANLDLTEITSVMQPDGVLIVEAPLPLSPEAEAEPKPKVTVLKFATEPEPKEKILTFETEPKLEPKGKLWKFESPAAPESKPKEREYENLLFKNSNNTEPNRNSFKFDTDPEPERLPRVRVLNFETEPTKPKDNLFIFNKEFITKPEENNSFKFDSETEPETEDEREPRVRILNFDTESESGVKITEITIDQDE